MSVFAQEGYGKSNKIDLGIQDGSLTGIVWSPRDEDPSSVTTTISRYKASYPDMKMIFDPQFYITNLVSPRAGRLPDYPYYRNGLTRASFSNPRNIQTYVKETLDYESTLQLDYLTSPSILFQDFSDPWSQVSLMMATESVNYHGRMHSVPPLLLSLIVSESALSSTGGLQDFLDAFSVMDAQGLYLIVQRDDSIYQATFDPTRLENLIYLVYVLAEINGFEVVCGYCDFIGLLLQAVGAKAICNGWYNNLRQFTMDRFLPSQGGRQPRPRYSSLPLLNSIFVEDMDNIYTLQQLPLVLSNTGHDRLFTSGRQPSSVSSSWSMELSTLNHWSVISRALTQLGNGTVTQKLDRCAALIHSAATIYSGLSRSGMAFDPLSNQRHLQQWRQAFINFRARINI